MTVIANFTQSYSPGPINRTFPINNPNMKEIRATLTNNGWPTPGEVVSIEVLFPDGTSAGRVGFSGGSLNRDGLPQVVYGIRNRTGNLPTGTYTLQANVSQAFTSTVLIERF